MSENKKNTPIMAVIAAVLLLAAGAITYFTQQTSPETTSEEIDQVAESRTDQESGVDAVTSQTEKTPVEADVVETPKKEGASEEVATPNVEGVNVEPGNPVVANVDGKDITRVDVYRFIQTMPANVQQMPAVQVYPMAMEQVINTRIVQTQAENAKIEETEEFQRELDIAKQQITRNLYLQKQVDAKITDKMVKSAYGKYIKDIPDVEERRARHILLETEDKAKAVIDKLNKGGDFEGLAKELSVGPTGIKGGDLGYFAKEEMVPEFANAAFGMKKETIIEAPVKTQFGWHVIQLVDVRQRPKPSFDQMAPALRADLSRTALDDLLKKWRKNAKVTQFDINGKPLKDGANTMGIVSQKDDSKG